MKTKSHISSIKLLVSLAVVCCLLVCCKDRNGADSPMKEIKIVVDTVRATEVKATFIPGNNNAWYTFGCMDSKEMEQYATDEQIIQNKLDLMQKAYNIYLEENNDISFSEMFLTKGKDNEVYHYLTPDADYCLFAFQVNAKDHTAIGPLYKLPFHTFAIDSADVSFDVSIKGDTLRIVPSNETTYLWDYELTTVIESEYSTPLLFFTNLVSMWEGYDFIQAKKQKGPVERVFSRDDNAIQKGLQYTLIVAGYNGEINTELTIVNFTVQ